MNAFKLAAALGFTLLSAAAAAQTGPSKDSGASLRRSARDAEAFSNTADGSSTRPDVAGPSFTQAVPDFDENTRLLASGGIVRMPAAVPPIALAQHSAPHGASPIGRNPLAAAGALGAGLFLALTAFVLSHSGSASVDSVVADLALARARPLVPAPAPVALETHAPAAEIAAEEFAAVETTSPPVRLAEPFIDTRMPVSTWRAISRHEQALIESWDHSREKALGKASFEQWLDRHPTAGVDVAGLKAKLARA